MSMKYKLLLAAVVAALSASFAVRAAEDVKEPTEKAAEQKAAKKKVRPHQHAADAKQGVSAPVSAEPQSSAQRKKPLHDHREMK